MYQGPCVPASGSPNAAIGSVSNLLKDVIPAKESSRSSCTPAICFSWKGDRTVAGKCLALISTALNSFPIKFS